MNPIRQLISQTAIYGLSSIVGRFLNYLLVPLYTYTFSTGEYGVVSEFYAYAGFFAVLLVWGLETGYFRFRQKEGYDTEAVYASALSFLVTVNLAFVAAMFMFREPLAGLLHYPEHPEYLLWFSMILALDAITALPFARLRAENRAWRFAGEIFLTIALNLFFLVACPKFQALWPESLITRVYDPAIGVGYIFLSNLLASAFKCLLLMPQFRSVRFELNRHILSSMLAYSLPMVVIGFAGMINEMLDRAILKFMLPYDLSTNLKMLGIYGACYNLVRTGIPLCRRAVLFQHRRTSRRQTRLCIGHELFRLVRRFHFSGGRALYRFFQILHRPGVSRRRLGCPDLTDGQPVAWHLCEPVNLVQADRPNRPRVSLAGASLTAALNIWWIPIWGYTGSAWATLCCYLFMVCLSWLLGRRFYPVAYNIGKITGYMGLGLLLYTGHRYLLTYCHIPSWSSAPPALVIYLSIAGWFDIRPLLAKRR